jgi:hypothetical protein
MISVARALRSVLIVARRDTATYSASPGDSIERWFSLLTRAVTMRLRSGTAAPGERWIGTGPPIRSRAGARTRDDAADPVGNSIFSVPDPGIQGWRIVQPTLLLLPVMCGLAGCGSLLTATTADVAGIAGAGVAGAVTKSPAAAAGIGLGIAAGANAGLQYLERDVHGAEQDRIAVAAGAIGPGVVGHWSVTHKIPIEDDEHGDVIVVRSFGSADFQCKEIVFSVDTVKDKAPARAFYTATVCRDGSVWKWASAEPATERWGSLQ